MSISIGGSTLTFSDSTTMTTASLAGPPGPAGPAGSPSSVAGPPGPTGTPSSTYGAVGSYVIAGAPATTGWTRPGCTAAGACLFRQTDTSCVTTYGGSLNTRIASYQFLQGYVLQSESLSLSGTWRAMTSHYHPSGDSTKKLNLWVRVS